jgi:LPXTG-motif cell wall-anchored protein
MRRCSTGTLSTIAAAAAAVVLTPGAAAASVIVPLHDAHEGASAADFASGGCAKENKAPPAGTVRWVFVLPHNDADFVGLALTFRTAGGTVKAVSIPDATDPYPDAITANGASKAWVVLPGGWTLQGGSATVTGATKARFFNLTHTCLGPAPTSTPSPSATPSPDTSPSTSPTPEATRTGGSGPGGTPSASTSPSIDVSAPASPSALPAIKPASETGGRLPVTGTAIGGMLLVGLAATALGALLVWRSRRREACVVSAVEA